MPVTQDMLVTELQNLLRLTAFEQTIATVRRTQARTATLEAELAANVVKARERSALLVAAIRQVGGVPDVVGSTVGKIGAFTTAQLNQVQTLQGALLGDLTLEHQLRERTRYARTLADSLGETSLTPLFDRLETAHTATIDWLETRLAEVARTGTSLLRATPLQAAIGSARRYAYAPLAAVAGTVNQATALLWKRTPQQVQDALAAAAAAADSAIDKGVSTARSAALRGEDAVVAAGTGVEALLDDAREAVAETVSTVTDAVDEGVATVVDTAKDTAETVVETAETVVDTAKETAESVADTAKEAAVTSAETVAEAATTATDTVTGAAQSAGETVAEHAEDAKDPATQLEVVDLTGTGDVAHPFPGYERLTGDRVMGHIRDTEDVAELTQLLAFEAAHKARKGVLAAAHERLTALSVSV